MIIERKYEYLFRLVERDKEAEKIYREACYHGYDEKRGQEIYEYNLQNKAYNIELGCGIIDPNILWNGFAELDKREPYDNGFTPNDIKDVEIIERSTPEDWGCEAEKPEWVRIAMINEIDGWTHYVKLIDITEAEE